MKRLILILLSVLGSCFLAGAQLHIPLLDRVPGHRVTCSYTYSVSKDGAPFSEVTAGSLEVEDNAFRLEALGLKMISDGTTRWTLDEEAREAVVEAVSQEDLLTNPVLLIGGYSQYAEELTVNASGKDFLDITLEMDASTRARFVLKDVVFGDRKGKSDFTFDGKSLPEDYLITDLR